METSSAKKLTSDDVLTLDPSALATATPRPPDSVVSVLRLCDGRRSIRQLVGECGYHPSTTLQVVFRAMDLGLIQKSELPEPAVDYDSAADFEPAPDHGIGVDGCVRRASDDILSNSIEFYQKLVQTDVEAPTIEMSHDAVMNAVHLAEAEAKARPEPQRDENGFDDFDEAFFGSYVPEEHLTREDLVAMGALKPKPRPRRKAARRQASRRTKQKGWVNRMSGWLSSFLSF